jgi:cation:H+ antiporter
MMAMTVALFVMAYGFRGEGRINRLEGVGLLVAFAAYETWLVVSVIAG